jgi:ligand-binding sensor domain-containing protein
MKKRSYLILSFALFYFSLFAQFATPRFQRLTTADGLPSGEVHQIREDTEGFIWLSTAEGLCRFDGYKTQPLMARDAQTTAAVNGERPLCFDWDGQKRWWIASDWAGVRIFDQAKNQFDYLQPTDRIGNYKAHHILDTLVNPLIISILYDGAQRVWIGTYQGLEVFDVSKNKMDRNPQFATPLFAGCRINQLAKDAAGNIWAAVNKKGLCRFDKRTQTWAIVAPHLEVRNFTFDTEGGVFWVSNNELKHYSPKTKALTQPFSASLNKLGVKMDLMSIHYDRVGRLWLGTTNGLILLRGGTIPPQVFRHDPRNPNSLLSDLITGIYEDKKGNIWLTCGSEGACMLSNAFERIQVFDNPTPSYRIEDIALAPDSTLYALTRTHLLVSRSPYYHTDFLPISNLIPCADATATQMVIGKNGKIYFTTECGIWEFLPKQKQCQLITKPKFSSKEMRGRGFLSLNIWGDSLLTFSHFNENGLHVFNLKTHAYQIFDAKELNQNLIFTDGMIQDKRGEFWSNSFNGLMKMGKFLTQPDTARFACFYFEWKNYDANNNGGKPLIQIGDDLWWGRSDGGGLSVLSLRDTAYGSFLKTNGLFDNSITCLTTDRQGKLWAGTTLGISHIELPIDFRTAKHIAAQNFSTTDGLPHNSVICSAATLAGDKIFVGTAGGLAMIYTGGVTSDTILPQIAFTNLTILNKTIRPYDTTGLLKTDINQTKSLTLQANQAFFTLEVSGLNFVNPQLTRYAYRLSGLSGDWIDNGFSPILSFNNMASGTYLLEVKAQASNGLWSPIKTLTINVLPPIWKRWWFITACLLAFMAGVYALYRMRIRQIQHLQTLQNNIAADLHDDVGAALTNIEILSFLSKNPMNDPLKTGNLIDKISEEAKKTNESLHQLVWAMKTENDGLEPTLAQLNRLAVDNLEIQGIDFSVKMPQQDLSNYRLVGERRRDLIMVFKEVLTNITKHAKATAVLVTIKLKNNELSIKIQDNGVGMDKETLGGNGLNNMAQRMARIGGHFEMSSPNTDGRMTSRFLREGVTVVLTLTV